MVAEALIGAELVSAVFNQLGFDVQPMPGSHRSDVIQAVRLGNPEILRFSFSVPSPEPSISLFLST